MAFPTGGGAKGGGKPESAAPDWLVLSRRVSPLGYLQREMLGGAAGRGGASRPGSAAWPRNWVRRGGGGAANPSRCAL